MLTPVRTRQFKKDFKKISRSGSKSIEKIRKVVKQLVAEKELETKFRNHQLAGNLHGFYECHVGPDLLLIYRIDKSRQELVLVRAGSHSELFD